MRRSFNTGIRRARITIATLAFVALGFILYYLKYVPNREHLVNQRNFRSLHQLESNIQSKKQNLFSVTSTYFKKIEKSTTKRSNPNVLTTHDVIRQPANLSYPLPDGTLVFSRIDSITESEFLQTKNEIKIDARGDSSNLVISKRVASSDTLNIHYRIKVLYPIFQFMKSLVNHDFFENYLIVHNGSIIYKSGFADLDSIKRDSIIPSSQVIISSGIKDISLAGIRYKLFILPFRLDDASTSYLCGLTPLQAYNNDKFHLPDGVIVAVAFIILFILLALPFFKILLISNMERLNTMDVLSSFLTLAFGCSLFILILLGAYFHNGLDFQSRETSLKLLHKDIDSSLVGEVDSAIRQIKSYSKLLVKYAGNDLVSKPDGDFEPYGKRSGTSALKESLLPPALAARKLPYKYVIWFDSAANELFSFTTDTTLPPKTNYATRRYFQMVKEKNLWSLPTNPRESFFLDGVYSYTSGQFRSTVSIPIDTFFKDAQGNSIHSVAAVLTGNFRSVIDPLLPPGFGFCIMEENGNVLFHSDTRKNLQENFLSECDRNTHLLAILHAQQSGCFEANYQGKDYRMYAAPIGAQIPLYLITFYDQSLFTGTNVQTFEYSSILAFINLLLVMLMSAVTFISQYRRNKVKKSLVDIEWLWPYKNKIQVYYINLLTNIVLAFTVILIFFLTHNEFFKLAVVGFNCLFTVGFFFVSNHANESLQTFRKLFPQFIICSVFLFLVMNGIAFVLLPTALLCLGFVLYEALVIIFGWRCLRYLYESFVNSQKKGPTANVATPETGVPSYRQSILLSFLDWLMQRKFSTAYCLMLVSWIVTVSIIPTFLFFQLAYNRENEILMKNSQVETVMKKNELTRKYTSAGDSLRYVQSNNLPSNNFLSDFQSTRFIKGSAADTLCVSCGGALSVNFLYRFFATGSRFPHNDVCISDNLLYLPCDKNQTYYWCFCKPWLIMQYRSTGTPGSPAFIESKLPLFALPSMFVREESGHPKLGLNISFFIFWISLFFFAWIITQVIMYFARELFAFDFFPDQKMILVGEQAIENIQSHQFAEEQQHMFITALPQAAPLEKFLEIVRDLQKQGKAQLIDCTQLTSVNGLPPFTESSIIVLQNLDLDIAKKETNDLRLQLVQSILSARARCILLSTRSASDFLETLSQPSTDASGTNRDEWNFLLSNFAQVYLPLQAFNYVDSLPLSQNLDRFIQEECSHGTYLKGIQLTLMHSMPVWLAEDLAGDEIKLLKYKDEVTLKVQSIASPYYRSIWASLSSAEKHVLYDIAQDGLVNTRNVRFINRLLNKGLLLYDDHLRIMNESFRNFILTGVDAEEISQLNQDVRNSGTWNRLRTPLLLIIAGVLVFMFATQQDIFNKTMLWAGTIIGALATLSRVFTFLPTPSAPGTSAGKSS